MTLGLSFIYMIRVYLLQVGGAGPGLVCRWEGCFSFCLWGRSVLVCSGDLLVPLGWASWDGDKITWTGHLIPWVRETGWHLRRTR